MTSKINFKKIWALLIALVMMVSVFSLCVFAEDKDADTSGSTTIASTDGTTSTDGSGETTTTGGSTSTTAGETTSDDHGHDSELQEFCIRFRTERKLRGISVPFQLSSQVYERRQQRLRPVRL